MTLTVLEPLHQRREMMLKAGRAVMQWAEPSIHREVHESRLAIEPMLACVSAKARPTRGLIMTLEQLLRLYRDGPWDSAAARTLGWRLHNEIARSTNSRSLAQMYDELVDRSAPVLAVNKMLPLAEARLATVEHLAIGKAIVDHEADAVKTMMRSHVARAYLMARDSEVSAKSPIP